MTSLKIEQSQGAVTPQSFSISTIESLDSISEIALQGEAIAISITEDRIKSLDPRVIERIFWDLQHKFERIAKLC